MLAQKEDTNREYVRSRRDFQAVLISHSRLDLAHPLAILQPATTTRLLLDLLEVLRQYQSQPTAMTPSNLHHTRGRRKILTMDSCDHRPHPKQLRKPAHRDHLQLLLHNLRPQTKHPSLHENLCMLEKHDRFRKMI